MTTRRSFLKILAGAMAGTVLAKMPLVGQAIEVPKGPNPLTCQFQEFPMRNQDIFTPRKYQFYTTSSVYNELCKVEGREELIIWSLDA